MTKNIERYIASLQPAMQDRMRSCSSTEEIMRLARTEGLELPDEALDTIYGGCTSYTLKVDDYDRCVTCKTRVQLRSVGHDGFPDVYYCPTCFTSKSKELQEVEHYHHEETVKK